MTLASDVEGAKMYAPDGTPAGTLVNILFHPSGEPVVVGAAVRPVNAMVVVGRPETYIPLSALRFEKGHVWLMIDKLPKARASADQLGYDPDRTIIWMGMPIVGPSGEAYGTLGDFAFDPDTGRLSDITVSERVTASIAYGQLVAPADVVAGYSEGAVHVSVEAADLESSGGLAKASAAAVAGASETASAVGEIVEVAVVRASGATGRAIRAAKESDIAGKAVRKVGSTWRDSVQAFKDGMKDDE